MPWLARQLVRLVVVLFCVTLLTYMIVNILPGDVAIVILGNLATPQDIAGLRADLGLDRPLSFDLHVGHPLAQEPVQ